MNSLSQDELTARYALLCRSTQSDLIGNPQGMQLAPHLATLRTLLKHDLRSLGRQGSPDDFADIYFELERELERFHEFCSFPKLSQKFVVVFGGGFSAGKSSLINTLLGKRLLVTEVDPTTSLPTYLLNDEEDAVHAHNLFGHRIGLSEEEFLSLTHDEVPRFGSNISRLLRSAFITRRDFPWQNLALIDTPGYTKHDDQQHSVRTDEQIARAQLNSAQAIVWVIDARQGGITEDDLKFLASLNPNIPRLIAVSRADQRPAEDVANIVAGIRLSLETRNLPVLDVVAVSARKKEWSPTPILEQLTHWNKSNRELRFAYNFKLQFTRYASFLENEMRLAQQHLNRLNRILALTEEESIQQDAEELKLKTDGELKLNVQLSSELASLRHRFFAELKAIGDHVGIPLPEPSELDMLDEQQFDLLKLLVQQREAEGVTAPDESATLRELMQPGDAPKIVAFLNGETKQTMGVHFAAKLDSHCRETYARFLAAIICYEGHVLSEVQSALFLKILETLGFKDIRTALFAQAQKMTGDDFAECKRIVAEHGLANNLFFDTLMLGRCNGLLNENHIRLFAELGSALDLDTKTVTGMAVLSGYILGVHARTEYASKPVLDLIHWHPLFFREMKKADTKNGIVTGYLKSNKRINLRYDNINAKNLVLMASDDVVFVSDDLIEVESSTIVSHGNIFLEGAQLLRIEDSEIQSLGKSKYIIFKGGGSWLGSQRVDIINSKILSDDHANFSIDGKQVLVTESSIKNANIEFSKGSVKLIGSDLTTCESIMFKCDEIPNVEIKGCKFSTVTTSPIITLKSNTQIYNYSACIVEINGCAFNYIGDDNSSATAILVEELSIENRNFYDNIKINLIDTNVKRGETIEDSSTLDFLRKFDLKYKYTGFESKKKMCGYFYK